MKQALAGKEVWDAHSSTGGSAKPVHEGAGMREPSDEQERLRGIWARVRARLKTSVGEDVFNSWFARLELEEMAGDLAHLSAPTRFLCSWIQSNYADRLIEAFKADVPEIARLQVTMRVNGQAAQFMTREVKSTEAPRAANTDTVVEALPANPAPARAVREPKGDALSGTTIEPRMTFDNFVAGGSNEIALGVARQVSAAVANGTTSFNPVYLHASVGLGKSHLLNAIANAALEANPQRVIVYLTADHFMYHFIQAVKGQSAMAFKDWLRRVDLLLIDDMQFLQGKSATEFGHTLGVLLSGARQVVVAADSPPRDLETLDERIRSRLSGGLVVPIESFDLDMRRDIVQRRADQATTRFGVHFPSAVIDYIARSVMSHGRDLDGAVNRLVAANQLSHELITVPLAERTLADLIRTRDVKRVRIEDILKIVSRHFKVPRNELLSARRSRDVVRPRQIAMYLAKALTSRSLPEIGRRFGGRDHTTVLHSVRKVEQMMREDPELAQEIELLKRMLEE